MLELVQLRPTMPSYFETSGLRSKITVRNLNFFYGAYQALYDNYLEIAENKVTAIVGPSGCGKTPCLELKKLMVLSVLK